MKRSGWTALFTQDPSIAHYRRGMRQPLLLLCSLALCAPACMAQSLPPAAGDDSQVARAAASADVPRSAMGRVMGIMIEALRQEAKRDDTVDAPQAGPTQVIEVGADFLLDAGPQVTSPTPVPVRSQCGVQPCERDHVPNLRIASQK